MTTPTNGYTRLEQAGPVADFVEFAQSANADTSLGPFPPGSHATYLVKVATELHFSDYPLPAAPPLTPIHLQPPPSPPQGFIGADGTPVTVIKTSNQVSEFTGKSKLGPTYSLQLETGNGKTGQLTWVYARLNITDSTDNSALQFGFAYCPLSRQFDLFLERGEVAIGIGVDLQPLSLDSKGNVIGSAALARDVSYYQNEFGSQSLSMPVQSKDPAMYLPIQAAFWPYLQRLAYFAPALREIASETADKIGAPAPSPLYALGDLYYDYTKTSAQWIAAAVALVGPALGPFAAEFIDPADTGSQPWIDGARWLGWALMQGTGNGNLVAALEADYTYYKNIVPPPQGGTVKIPIYKPPSPNLSPASRANDFLANQSDTSASDK
jgi:hypothetical protein